MPAMTIAFEKRIDAKTPTSVSWVRKCPDSPKKTSPILKDNFSIILVVKELFVAKFRQKHPLAVGYLIFPQQVVLANKLQKEL